MSVSFSSLKQLIEKRKLVLEQAGQILTRASKENRALTALEESEWTKRHEEGDRLLGQITKYETQANAENALRGFAPDNRICGREDFSGTDYSPTGTRDNKGYSTPEEKRAFAKWLIGGPANLNDEERALLNKHETRDLGTVTGSAGGYTVPQGFQYVLDTALKQFGGILEAGEIIPTDQGNVMPYPTLNDTSNTGEQSAENTTVSGGDGGAAEVDPTFGQVVFNAYMLDSGIVKMPIQLIEDSAFNIDTILGDALQVRLGRKINALGTTGDGASKPTGIVTASTLGATTASPTAIAYADLLNIEHAVDPAYRKGQFGCGYMFNDSTLKAIRNLVDGNGRPLFIAGGVSEGIQNRAPDTLSGWPIFLNQDVDSIGASKKPILFGAFKKFKVRRVRSTMLARLNERFMDKLQIGFIAYQRIDTNLVDAGTHPVQYLQCHA